MTLDTAQRNVFTRLIASSFSDRHNFSGGPGVLPDSVLAQAQQSLIEAPGAGISLLGVSHRSSWFRNVLDEAEENIRCLLSIPAEYHVLFLQGGGTMQFSMAAMHMLRGKTDAASYITCGYWSDKALCEARKEGKVEEAWRFSASRANRVPNADELVLLPNAPCLHYVSNETVEGLQFHYLPGLPEVPRVCDMSSDFLSRPFNIHDYALVYAHAQKNLGPSGVTIAVVHDDVIKNRPPSLPAVLDYSVFAQHRSNYNTPPVFAIYVVNLVTRWLRHEIGGLNAMHRINAHKAQTLYDALEKSGGFYTCHAEPQSRSLMNVTFRLPSPRHDAHFLAQAEAAGFVGLTGHRMLGGIRASLYNGMTQEAVEDLVQFLHEYQRTCAWEAEQ